MVGVFLAGVGPALLLRARNPEGYRKIRRIVYDGAARCRPRGWLRGAVEKIMAQVRDEREE
jgi:hypothetical protein